MSDARQEAARAPATGSDPAPGDAEVSGTSRPQGAVSLGKYITIDVSKPLSQLDRPFAQAFGAVDSRTPTQTVYALVCEAGRLPRLDVLGALNRISNMPLVTPVEWGLVEWAPTGRGGAGEQRYALVFDKPAAPPLASSSEAPFTAMREEQIVERVLRPIVPALREMEERGITHRAISVDNLFAADGSDGGATLGECVSAPGGMLQPGVYETIDAAQALPAGRGAGTIADDLYALGVTMAILLRGGDPTVGIDPDAVIARKIDRSSYATLIGRARVSLKLMEPLRGLLCDKVDERWDLAALDIWLNGRHQSPKQPSLPSKARRGFSFGGTDYWTCPGLAHALASDWQEGLHAISGTTFEQWATRSLADEKQSKMLQATLAASRGEEIGPDGDRALARVLVALDLEGPVRMPGFVARVDALAQLLAVDYDDVERRNAFVQVLRAKLPQRWLESQTRHRGDHPQAVERFDRMIWLLDRQQPGYGLERVLYEFNPDWPCQSALISAHYVSDLVEILPALETRAMEDIPESMPMDRHLAAFYAARTSRGMERLLQGLGHTSGEQQAQAMIDVLAELQNRYGPQRLPALTEWAARHVGFLSQSLHHRDLREKVGRRIKRAVEAGSLVDLRTAVADRDLHRRDARGFAVAKAHYAQAAREIAWLEDGGLTSDSHIAWTTRGVATAISAVCSGLIAVLLSVFYVS